MLSKGALIVGSTAIKHHFPDFPREPKDLDALVSTGYSCDISGDLFSHELLDELIVPGTNVATVNFLYTLKVSHSYYELKNGSHDKHIFDMRWLKRRGAQLDLDLHQKLYKVWTEIHGKKKTTISMEKGEFFKDAVTRIYDHDSLHSSVAFHGEAMYERILKDGSTVDVDSAKMWALSHEDLVRLFREEVYATALERILVPTNYHASAGAAYRWSLRRTLTSLTTGRSARWIAENFEEFANPYVVLGEPDDYLARHHKNKDRLIRL